MMQSLEEFCEKVLLDKQCLFKGCCCGGLIVDWGSNVRSVFSFRGVGMLAKEIDVRFTKKFRPFISFMRNMKSEKGVKTVREIKAKHKVIIDISIRRIKHYSS